MTIHLFCNKKYEKFPHINKFYLSISIHSAPVDADQVIQQETLPAQMDILNHRPNVPNSVLLNTNNAKIKIIADGVTESGKIALVLAIRRDVLHVGMDIRIKQLPIVPMKINQFHDSVVMHRQTVSSC